MTWGYVHCLPNMRKLPVSLFVQNPLTTCFWLCFESLSLNIRLLSESTKSQTPHEPNILHASTLQNCCTNAILWQRWESNENPTHLWSSWTPFAGWFWHPAGARPPLTSSTAESLVLLTADPPWVSSTLANPPNSQCPIPPTPVFLTVALWWRKSRSNPWWDVWYASINEDPALITMRRHCWPMVCEYRSTTHEKMIELCAQGSSGEQLQIRFDIFWSVPEFSLWRSSITWSTVALFWGSTYYSGVISPRGDCSIDWRKYRSSA